MKSNIVLLDSAKTANDYLKAAKAFKKTGTLEKNNWLVNYYTGMSYILAGFKKQEEEDVDPWCDTADVYINRADSLSKDNSEIYVLKSMSASLRIMADPMSRGMMYGKKSYDCSLKAMTLNPENPRTYLNKGQGVLYTPEAFGGGPVKAKPHLEKAIEKYKTFKPESEIHPNWGKALANDLLKQCEQQ